MNRKQPTDRRGGRPMLGAEKRVRYQVMIEPAVAARLRQYGGNNLSAGIARAAKEIATR